MQKHRTRKVVCAAPLIALLMLLLNPAFAQDLTLPQTDLPVLMTADELTFDDGLDLATANGNVEITQGDRVLLADTLTFNQRTNVITASGNVVLLEPSGEVIFAEFVELTDDLKEGFIRQFRMLLQDDSRLAAVSGRRLGGVETRLDKAVYSPCRECIGVNEVPLWRIKATRVIHNQETRDIEYVNARMEIAGVPVFYTPYFRHPDPTVKRRSGFLSPRFGASTDLGTTLVMPYFLTIGDDKDITFDPIFTSKQNIVGQAEYRQAFDTGTIRARFGGTVDELDSNGEFRGYTDSSARFDLSDVWRTGADLRISTDDTFLRRYAINSASSLTSRAFAEGFRGRDYARAEGLYFQSLRALDDQDEVPIIAPKIDYHLVSEPDRNGAQWLFSTENFVVTRLKGTDSRRLSVTGGWRLPYIGPAGDVFTLEASLQTDLYHVSDVPLSDGTKKTGFTGRVFPQISLEWRYPFVRTGSRLSQLIEPIVQFVAAPNGGNPEEIPNEDSLIFEFDETNLFSRSRFVGRDRVEGGRRVSYGLRTGLFDIGGASASAFVGQSYRFRKDDTYPVNSGLNDKFSDFVGRIQVTPNRFGNLLYKTRIDKDSLNFRRNELQLSFGPPALNLNTNYLFFQEDDEFAQEREEISVTLRSNLTDQWFASIDVLRDLKDDETRSWGGSLTYTCDCLVLSAQYRRRFFKNQDIQPADEFFIRINFKNLGTIQNQIF